MAVRNEFNPYISSSSIRMEEKPKRRATSFFKSANEHADIPVKKKHSFKQMCRNTKNAFISVKSRIFKPLFQRAKNKEHNHNKYRDTLSKFLDAFKTREGEKKLIELTTDLSLFDISLNKKQRKELKEVRKKIDNGENLNPTEISLPVLAAFLKQNFTKLEGVSIVLIKECMLAAHQNDLSLLDTKLNALNGPDEQLIKKLVMQCSSRLRKNRSRMLMLIFDYMNEAKHSKQVSCWASIVGIFRVSAEKTLFDQYMKKLDLAKLSKKDIHILIQQHPYLLCSLIKQALKGCCLFNENERAFDALLRAITYYDDDSNEPNVDNLKSVLQELDTQTLRILKEFVNLIKSHVLPYSEQNQMNVDNIGFITGPSICMLPIDASTDFSLRAKRLNDLATLLFTEDTIFDGF